MVDFLLRVLWETWNVFKQASVFLLFGFLLAGVLAVVVPEKALSRLFRKGKIKSVFWAAAIGAPLPLCSCGVVPAALGLRRQGATPGATAAFLIATPETGVDSISLSYALTDLVTTVFRPVAAVVTAITAGIWINFLGMGRTQAAADHSEPQAAGAGDTGQACAHDHTHDHGHDVNERPAESGSGLRYTAGRIYRYAFHQLLDDTSYWVLLGIVLSGVVAAAMPPTFFERYLNNELASMLVMLLISMPIYVCASEATPLAAALVMKGLSPGAALVFLLAGPATNIGSLVVLMKFLGTRVVAIYLSSIVIVTLLAGFALNWTYRVLGLDPRATFGAATSFIPEPVKIASAVLLIVLLALSMRRTPFPAEWLWTRDRLARLTGVRVTAFRVAIVAAAVSTALYVGSGFFAVQPGEVGVTTRFGRIVASDLGPGLHYRLPWPFDAHRIVPTERVQRVEFGLGNQTKKATRLIGGERMNTGGNPIPDALNTSGAWFQKDSAPEEPFLLTGDGNLIDLRWALQYRVKDPVAFSFNVAEPDAYVRSVSLAALRSIVARSGIDAIYTSERSGVEEQVARTIQQTLDKTRIGAEILTFHLLYVHAPEEVHDAFRDVASAQEDKLRTINRANIFAVETVNQAKGEAAAMVEQALAFKEQQIKHAQGDAGSFLLRLGAYRHAPELTKFRLQVETIEETLPGMQKFVRPGAGEIKDFDMWLLQPVGASKGK
jgi:HflK protein